jgi:hypothetical protein
MTGKIHTFSNTSGSGDGVRYNEGPPDGRLFKVLRGFRAAILRTMQ